MTKNLNTADLIAKLALSVVTILSYFLHTISGQFAEILVVLSFLVLLLYIIKVVMANKD